MISSSRQEPLGRILVDFPHRKKTSRVFYARPLPSFIHFQYMIPICRKDDLTCLRLPKEPTLVYPNRANTQQLHTKAVAKEIDWILANVPAWKLHTGLGWAGSTSKHTQANRVVNMALATIRCVQILLEGTGLSRTRPGREARELIDGYIDRLMTWT